MKNQHFFLLARRCHPALYIGLIRALIIAISFFTITEMNGQSAKTDFRYVNWGVESGLSQAEITRVIKDADGFLWIATKYGLDRFDGYNFHNYFETGTNSKKGLLSNTITGLIEDSLHNIWVGSLDGLSCYYLSADTFWHLRARKLQVSIVPFHATRKEVFCWNYTDSNFIAVDIRSHKIRSLRSFKGKPQIGIGVSDQNSFYDERTNSIWVLKDDSSYLYRPNNARLLQISLNDNSETDYLQPCALDHDKGSLNTVEGFCFDKERNSFWINSPDGLVQFNLSNKTFTTIPGMEKYSRLDAYRNWAAISLDKLNRIWFSTLGPGILIYNPANKVLRPLFNDSTLQGNISMGNITLYCDRDTITWIGSWTRKGLGEVVSYSKAVTRFDWKNTDVPKLSSENIINSMYGPDNEIWLGTPRGLNIYNPELNSVRILHEKDFPGFHGEVIIPMEYDSARQKVWIFGDPPLAAYEYDIKIKLSKRILLIDSSGKQILQQNVFMPKARPFQGRLLIPLLVGNTTIICLQEKNGPNAHEILRSDDIGVFTNANDDKHIFLRSRYKNINYTFILVNDKLSQVVTSIDSLKWTAIHYDQATRTIWVAHSQKLSVFDKDLKLIKTYSSSDQVPVLPIFGMIADNIGNMWFNTERAIYYLNIKSGIIDKLNAEDGYEKQDYTQIAPPSKDRWGHIYYPAGFYGTGFDLIMPEKINRSGPSSSVYFSSVLINQRPFQYNESINRIESLNLSHAENQLAIQTGILDFFSAGKGSIRYKLQGVNTEWQYAPAFYTIRYDGLPANHYRLIIQAKNALTQDYGPEKVLLINIAPPIWGTWWFILSAIILFVTGLVIVIRYALKRKYETRLSASKHKAEVSAMRQMTMELEMQALRAQMNPHFIFNSLNSVNRFILQNNRLQASEYLTKFSKLVRLILQNSQEALVPLESELESLKLYLDLEALRFDNRFDYKVSVPDNIDIFSLKLPPLIIQPYCENAIWHGLMPKEEKGQLDIDISQEGEEIFFKITDNGVGRRKSEALSSKSATKHKSMGLRITADRIEMLQRTNVGETSIVINDLMTPEGEAAGTEVTIKLPAIYD